MGMGIRYAVLSWGAWMLSVILVPMEVGAWGGHPQQVRPIFDRLPAAVTEGMSPEDIQWAIQTGSLYPDNFDPFEPDRFGAATGAAFEAHGLRDRRYDMHADKGRAVAFLQLVRAMREGDPPRIAAWIAAYAHSVGDMASANHDPALHVASYDWSDVLMPNGSNAQRTIRPRVELPWLVSTPEGWAAVDAAVEAMRIPDDGAPVETVLARIMYYGHEGGAFLSQRGAEILDAVFASDVDPRAMARLRTLMAELDAWGIVRVLRDVDAAARLAATFSPPDSVTAETQNIYERIVEEHIAKKMALADHAIYREIVRDGPAPIGVVLEPKWRMEEAMLGFTAYVNAALCRTLQQEGRSYRTIDLRAALSEGLPAPSEMPVLIITAARMGNYWSLRKDDLDRRLAEYLGAGGKVLWIFGRNAPPDAVASRLSSLTPESTGERTSWPALMEQPGTTHLRVGDQDWPLARTPATPAGWHKPAAPFFYPSSLPDTIRSLANLRGESGDEFLVAVAGDGVVVAPIYAFHPLLFGEAETLRATPRPTLDEAGEALLDASLKALSEPRGDL